MVLLLRTLPTTLLAFALVVGLTLTTTAEAATGTKKDRGQSRAAFAHLVAGHGSGGDVAGLRRVSRCKTPPVGPQRAVFARRIAVCGIGGNTTGGTAPTAPVAIEVLPTTTAPATETTTGEDLPWGPGSPDWHLRITVA